MIVTFKPKYPLGGVVAALSCLSVAVPVWSQPVQQLESIKVLSTAEEELKESLGVSIISAEDIEKNPAVTDLTDILRKEPGVNLTGSANSGMRGNRRQIDIRGMGPDNTMVLIDGKPATSRNASRQGWTGERDTDGDTGWVPPEAIERVEVLRGPAAARYGSGAMGGVVNIITKRPTDAFHGSVTAFRQIQEDSKEGDNWRTTFNLSGPISDRLGFRFYGGYSKTQPDAIDINKGHAPEKNGFVDASGKTGTRDKYINGLISVDITPEQRLDFSFGSSRKSDLYSGDTQNTIGSSTENGGNFIPISELYNSETTILYRNTVGLSHHGDWSWGTSRVDATYTQTRNNRGTEGLFGGPEGAFLSGQGTSGQDLRYNSVLKEARLDGEVNIPFMMGGIDQMLTVGGEVSHESLDDPGSLRKLVVGGNSWEPPTLPGRNGKTKTSYTSGALYFENNMMMTPDLTLIPTIRFNQHEEFGFNVSPGLTASYALGDFWSVKGGIARAYKTPSMYQSNPNYLLYSQGIGCRPGYPTGGCYLQGNDDLKSETSINKEIGIAYDDGELSTSLTYFRNDYKNKIMAGVESYGTVANGRGPADILKWENTPKAVVSGLEGNLFMPLSDTVDWNTNFTYMLESKDKTYNQPLSIIPKYTVNSYVRWMPTEKLTLQANVTWYGKQEAADFDIRKGTDVSGPSLNPYALVGFSGGYEVSKNVYVKAGVNNFFDKKLYRYGLSNGNQASVSNSAGARTYNEHGRSVFVDVRASF